MRVSEAVGRWFSRSRSQLVILTLAALAAFLVLAIVAIGSTKWAGAQTSETGYQKKEPPLETPWTDEVGPNNALPEYPRPQMTRERWQNLNGVWQFASAEEGEAPTFGQDLEERILVPYPVESALSGIMRSEERMFYRRTFRVPSGWQIGAGERLILHFGAVDYD